MGSWRNRKVTPFVGDLSRRGKKIKEILRGGPEKPDNGGRPCNFASNRRAVLDQTLEFFSAKKRVGRVGIVQYRLCEEKDKLIKIGAGGKRKDHLYSCFRSMSKPMPEVYKRRRNWQEIPLIVRLPSRAVDRRKKDAFPSVGREMRPPLHDKNFQDYEEGKGNQM